MFIVINFDNFGTTKVCYLRTIYLANKQAQNCYFLCKFDLSIFKLRIHCPRNRNVSAINHKETLYIVLLQLFYLISCPLKVRMIISLLGTYVLPQILLAICLKCIFEAKKICFSVFTFSQIFVSFIASSVKTFFLSNERCRWKFIYLSIVKRDVTAVFD